MRGILVPYARFLEIRERRGRVQAELTPQPVAPPLVDSLPRQPAIIDCEPLRDEPAGARSGILVGGAEDCVG